MMQSGQAARVSLLGAAVLFSTGGAAIKLLSFTGWQVACMRSALAAGVIWLLLPQARKAWTPGVLAVAVCFAATMIFYALANKLTTAANAIFLQSTAPLYLLILGPLLLKEAVHKADLLLMVVLGTGLALLLTGQETVTAAATDPVRGNILAACAGVSWALTVLGLRWQSRRGEAGDNSALTCVVAGNVLACLAAGTMAFPIPAAPVGDWMVVIYLGVAQIALAYFFLTRGISKVPALEASLLLLLEPVLSPVWAWLVHREEPSLAALAGGAMILLATVIRAITNAERATPAN
ncbi:MAG: DMT family transporter [Chromatiales bacterium]|nr:DMT family transporter [Chromatiales bacterium]